ncbi:MAG: class I SAM-dependent methyltransferase [Planctomycetota bacterium]
MRYLIGQRHREIILEHLPAGGRLLEFGSGTSSVWLAERLHEGASMLSVEHDAAWFDRVQQMLAPFDRCEQILRVPTGTLGPNASAGEERPDLLREYIHAADDRDPFDVILVDGVARDACLEHARSLLKPGGTIVLHDAQRPWYDRGKQTLTAHGHAGSCPDYPGPHLWWGGTAESAQPSESHGELPLIVSYYTKDTPYEDEARGLIASLDALGLEHRVTGLPVTGSWIENCGRKVRLIRETWQDARRPVLWLDADARVHARPDLFAGIDADFAVRCFLGWAFGSGTVFFNSTALAGMLLDDWLHRVETEPTIGEQIHLDTAWEALACRAELRTLWLPPSHAMIFDEPARKHISPVIEHFQASRRLAPEQQTERRIEVNHTAARVARLARRPREETVRHTWHHPDVPTEIAQRPPVGPTSMPDPVKRGLADRLALELVLAGVQRVALYGGGAFTRSAVLPSLADRGIRVLCIADDSPKDTEIDGIPVMPPADAARRPGLEAVVASSDAHEAAIADRAAGLFTVPVLRVVDWPRNRAALAASLVG